MFHYQHSRGLRWRREWDSPTRAQKPLNLLAKISGLDEVYHLCDSPQASAQMWRTDWVSNWLAIQVVARERRTSHLASTHSVAPVDPVESVEGVSWAIEDRHRDFQSDAQESRVASSIG